VHQRYAIDNPLGFTGYGEHCWGITAREGPGPAVATINGIERRFYDYEGRGAPYGLDDGTLAPWGVIASMPFAPEIVLPTIDYCLHGLQLDDGHRYGLRATFNQTYGSATGSNWVSPWHFGLNLGPIVLMTENHRSGMVWKLMHDCRYIVAGLRRAGFEGGWLNP
ncbi:MAG: glucoamylase family protein, partial [Dokdonella sp.]